MLLEKDVYKPTKIYTVFVVGERLEVFRMGRIVIVGSR